MFKSFVVWGCAGLCLLLSPKMTLAQANQLEIRPEALTQGSSSQNELTPLELNQFSQAIKQLQILELKNQQRMTAAIKDEGLEPERYVEIEQTARNRSFRPETPITSEEEEKFVKAATRIQEIWQEAQPKREKAVTTQGLTLERFAQINQIVAQNPDLQKQVEQMTGMTAQPTN
ncbi:MAG: DUF4168 domain-containing protein [Microcystaceae cyanobacterium]